MNFEDDKLDLKNFDMFLTRKALKVFVKPQG